MSEDNEMDSDGKFWAWVWTVAVVGILSLAVTVSSCTQSTKTKIVKAVEAGANPLDAHCALADSANLAFCVLRAPK